MKAIETFQTLRTSETNLQDSERLTSSAEIEVLIMSAFEQIEKEVSTIKATETSSILELSEAISFSAQVTSNFFTTISNQTIVIIKALTTTHKHSEATDRHEMRWWMLFLTWLDTVFIQ